MYEMYVHIKAVTYVSFPNKQDFLPNVKHVYILAVSPIMFVEYYLGNWIWLWTMLIEKKKEAFVTMWKENYQHTISVNKQMVL